MLPDVAALLTAAEAQYDEIVALYAESVTTQEIDSQLPVKIKNFLENCRSALDFAAVAITEKYGTKGTKVYWPYAYKGAKFDKWFDKNMPGVRANRPDIAAAIKHYQPFGSAHPWLKTLFMLCNDNKHCKLTKQLRDDVHWVEVEGPAGVRSAYNDGVTFGATGWGLDGNRHGAFIFGDGGPPEVTPQGIRVAGVLIDPATQRPYPGQGARVREDNHGVWRFFSDLKFAGAHGTVTWVLHEIRESLRPALEDVLNTAGI